MKKCKLCEQYFDKLHNESHIIPRWVYKYTQPNSILEILLTKMKTLLCADFEFYDAIYSKIPERNPDIQMDYVVDGEIEID